MTVAPGDAFMIPYGTRTIWHVDGLSLIHILIAHVREHILKAYGCSRL